MRAVSLEQRRRVLCVSLSDLMDIIANYRLNCPPDFVENPFLHELERQIQEKTKELESIDAILASPSYRYWKAFQAFKVPLWISTAALALVFLVELYVGGAPLLWGAALLGGFCLSVWVSRNPYQV